MKALVKRLSSPNPEFRHILIIASSLAMAGGLLEGIISNIINAVPGWVTWRMRSTNVSPEILWIAPAFYLLLFVAIALLLGAASGWRKKLRLFPHVTVEVIAVFLFTWLSVYALTRVPGRMHGWASYLLALGVAVQAGRWFLSRPELAIGIVRRSLPVLLILVVAAAGATTGFKTIREAILIRQLPPATPDAPNVLLIVLDTVRADHLSCYGYGRPTTPNIDAVARDGVRFENAIATSSWTPPTHASLMTGRYVYEHNTDSQQPLLSEQHSTLAEVLSSQGYVTGGFSANTNWVTSVSGFDRGFHHFEDYFGSITDMSARTIYGKEFQRRVLSRLKYRDTLGRKRASDINSAFLSWLDDRRGRPFFVFLNYLDAHSPYLSPEHYHTLFMDRQQRVREKQDSFNPPATYDGSGETIELWIAGYDGALNYLDAELGKLFDELRSRNLLDNTLVVITSDHGEAFGEHDNLFQHGHSLYRELIHVPLIIRFPRKVPAGLTISPPVSLRDVPRTITSLAVPGASSVFPGESLAAFWSAEGSKMYSERKPLLAEVSGREGVHEAMPISKGWVKSLITPQWHFIIYESGRVELYDIKQDPKEIRNLAYTPTGRGIVDDFKTQLQKRLSSETLDTAPDF